MSAPNAPFRRIDSETREVDRLIADGLLEPLLPGVVGPRGCSADVRLRVVAAALAVPERLRRRGVLAQAAAAWVWCGGDPPPVVDVTVEPGRAAARTPTLAVHERRMPPHDIVRLPAGEPVSEQLAITTATRTVVDLMRLLPAHLVPAALAPLLDLPEVTYRGVRSCLEQMPRARGVRQARDLIEGLGLVEDLTGQVSPSGQVSRSACR